MGCVIVLIVAYGIVEVGIGGFCVGGLSGICGRGNVLLSGETVFALYCALDVPWLNFS